MSLELLIDGYNLIRQSLSLSQIESVDLEQSREALLERLAVYRRNRGHRITVVFDGAGNLHLQDRRMNKQGIIVVFTGAGKTADEWIKRKVGAMNRGVVVTSDREIRAYAEQANILTVSSQEFEKKIEEALYRDLKGMEHNTEEMVIRTFKRGPERRLSKKDRNMRTLWEML